MSLLLAALLCAAPVVVLEARGKTHGSPDGGESGDADRLYGMARTDLAKRLGLEERQVKKVSMEPRTWPDASLGCPKPDTMYAQVETPGYLIELEASGKKYAYHSDRRRVVRCE
jgi:hypothetical protein